MTKLISITATVLTIAAFCQASTRCAAAPKKDDQQTRVDEILLKLNTENAKLKKEVSRLQMRQDVSKSKTAQSEAKRLKQELDQLMQMHSLVSNKKNKQQETSRPAPLSGNEMVQGSSMMKKMMMFMMMSELI